MGGGVGNRQRWAIRPAIARQEKSREKPGPRSGRARGLRVRNTGRTGLWRASVVPWAAGPVAQALACSRWIPGPCAWLPYECGCSGPAQRPWRRSGGKAKAPGTKRRTAYFGRTARASWGCRKATSLKRPRPSRTEYAYLTVPVPFQARSFWPSFSRGSFPIAVCESLPLGASGVQP